MQEHQHYEHTWNPPLSLEGKTLPRWPQNVFSEPFNTYVSELSRSTETPIELSALLSLAVVAAASQSKYEVQIKSDYTEPVNIWVLGILPPASRKSRIYTEVSYPLKVWENEQRELIGPEIALTSSKRKTIEARIKELRNSAAKAKEDDECEEIQDQIEELERTLPEVPSYPQIWTSDVTPEHLGNIMASNDESMAVLSDEGGIFDILGGLYSDGKANIDLFLQGHAGSSVRVDRGSRSPVCMDRAVLTMGLTVQPQVVKSMCNNKTFRGRGLLGRFLYVMPASNIGKRNLEEPPMQSGCSKLYQSAIGAILNQPYLMDGEQKKQYVLSLSSEAFEKWLQYSKVIEAYMGEEIGRLTSITDWAGKLPGAIARIASLLHIMRYAHGEPWKHSISFDDMAAAVKIGHCLIEHALAVFDLLDEDNAVVAAKTIYQWIKRDRMTIFTQRDCMRRFRRYKKTDLLPAFEVLTAYEIMRPIQGRPEGSIGRGRDVFAVNPLVFKK